MEESTTTPEPVTNEEPAPEVQRTFTQDDVNRILANDKRKEREALTALQTEIVALREKAAKLDTIEAEQMTATEKATKERDEALARIAEMESREKAAQHQQVARDVALKVAEDLGIPTSAALKLAAKLDGEDEDTLRASATELFGLMRPATAPVPAAVNDVSTPKESEPFLAGMAGEMARLYPGKKKE